MLPVPLIQVIVSILCFQSPIASKAGAIFYTLFKAFGDFSVLVSVIICFSNLNRATMTRALDWFAMLCQTGSHVIMASHPGWKGAALTYFYAFAYFVGGLTLMYAKKVLIVHIRPR
jgi:hypothetical protein